MRVRFACGHSQAAKGDEVRIMCETCGDSRVAAVQARAPKFVGHARGPCAKFKALPAKAVSFHKE